MKTHRDIPMKNGKIYAVRYEPTSATQMPLTVEEELIHELQDRLEAIPDRLEQQPEVSEGEITEGFDEYDFSDEAFCGKYSGHKQTWCNAIKWLQSSHPQPISEGEIHEKITKIILWVVDKSGLDLQSYEINDFLSMLSDVVDSHHPYLNPGFEHLPNDAGESGVATDHTVISQPISEERIKDVYNNNIYEDNAKGEWLMNLDTFKVALTELGLNKD